MGDKVSGTKPRRHDPVSPAQATDLSEIDRSLRIHPLAIPAELLFDGEGLEGHVTNLSETGAFFNTSETSLGENKPGSHGQLRFMLPFDAESLELNVRIRWRSVDGGNPKLPGCGLVFDEVDDEQVRLLRSYVSRFRSIKAQLDALEPDPERP